MIHAASVSRGVAFVVILFMVAATCPLAAQEPLGRDVSAMLHRTMQLTDKLPVARKARDDMNAAAADLRVTWLRPPNANPILRPMEQRQLFGKQMAWPTAIESVHRVATLIYPAKTTAASLIAEPTASDLAARVDGEEAIADPAERTKFRRFVWMAANAKRHADELIADMTRESTVLRNRITSTPAAPFVERP